MGIVYEKVTCHSFTYSDFYRNQIKFSYGGHPFPLSQHYRTVSNTTDTFPRVSVRSPTVPIATTEFINGILDVKVYLREVGKQRDSGVAGYG
jgi:hypothetical protein